MVKVIPFDGLLLFIVNLEIQKFGKKEVSSQLKKDGTLSINNQKHTQILLKTKDIRALIDGSWSVPVSTVVQLSQITCICLIFPFEETKNFCSTIVTHFVVGDLCKNVRQFYLQFLIGVLTEICLQIPERSDTSE